MGTKTVRRRLHIKMDINALDDQQRFDSIAAIMQSAPLSKLYASVPEIKSIVASLPSLGLMLQTKNAAVAADRAQLTIDLGNETNARSNVDSALLVLKTLFETNAASEDDLVSGGFKKRSAKPAKPALLPPDLIDIKYPKGIVGQFSTSAHEIGGFRGRYAVQICTDLNGQGPWIDLKGTGKSRKVTGYKSGTLVWVRYALVRGHDQSEWGTPVSVVVP